LAELYARWCELGPRLGIKQHSKVAARSRALFATMIGPHRAHSFLIRALAKYDAAARS
jgi:hypothetical protein